MTIRLAAILVLSLAITAGAQTGNPNNPNNQNKRVIHTLPMVKLGESPSYITKPIGTHAKRDSHPPQIDPYQWIVPPETGTVSRVWMLTNGTNVTGGMVKLNHFKVVVRQENEQEVQIVRKALDPKSAAFVTAFEKQAEADAIAEWNEKQAAKAEKEDAVPAKPGAK